MESCRNVPRIIPDALLNVLCILEEDSGRFLWNLSRNQDGLSLVIKTRQLRAHRGRHRRRKINIARSVSSANLEKDSSTSSSNVTEPRKKKPPSKLARDKARTEEYHRRRAAGRETRKTAPIVEVPTDSHPINEPDAIVCDTRIVEELNRSQPANIHSADNSQLEESSSCRDADIDSDDDSHYSDEEHKLVNISCCAHCKSVSVSDLVCSSCEVTVYCSQKCRTADLSWHAFVCRPLSTDF